MKFKEIEKRKDKSREKKAEKKCEEKSTTPRKRMSSYLFFHWEASVQRAHIERGIREAASRREKQERGA